MRGTAIGGFQLGAILVLRACSVNWQPVTHPGPFDERTVVEFHAKGTIVRWHAVRLSRDSASGIPWLDHLTCDTCRAQFALADISDLKTGTLMPVGGVWWCRSRLRAW